MNYLIKVLLFDTVVVNVITTYHKGQIFGQSQSKSNVHEKLPYFGKLTRKNVGMEKHH